MKLLYQKNQSWGTFVQVFLAYSKIKFTMVSIHSKLTTHGKKQENAIRVEETHQMIEICKEMTQMLKCGEKNIKTNIVRCGYYN